MRKALDFKNIGKIVIGCGIFAVGFDLFLLPNGLNAGGISGLSMVLVTVLRFGTIGIFTGIFGSATSIRKYLKERKFVELEE